MGIGSEREAVKGIPFNRLFLFAASALVALLYWRAAEECEGCPAGSVGVVVRGTFGPECVCSAKATR